MDINEKIQLGENRFINAENVDTSIKIPLTSTKIPLVEYDVKNVLDITQIFDDERQTTEVYRLHGAIEYFSVLAGTKIDYSSRNDIFKKNTILNDTKNLLTDFNIYLVKPSSNEWELLSNTTSKYKKEWEVVAPLSIVEISKAGFAKNIFNEQKYAFVINGDIDLTGAVDGLGFPLTEIGLYFEYKTSSNGTGENETLKQKSYNNLGGTSSVVDVSGGLYNIGDIVSIDIIEYNRENFIQTNFNTQLHYITVPHFISDNSSTIQNMILKYSPIVPIQTRFFSDTAQRANINSSSPEVVNRIPDYAIELNDGNFVWRDILDKGFFDPLTDTGISFPFINQRHYIFKNIILKVTPDLTNTTTRNIFNNIKYGNNTLININPVGNLDEIGDLC